MLARRLLQLGYDCIIVAPTAVPQAAGDKKVKTDPLDARKLARYLRSGDLVGINIPDGKDEAVRDLCRARTDASEAAPAQSSSSPCSSCASAAPTTKARRGHRST